MISLSPNMRNVKPLTKYMEKRIRMIGRQRMARDVTMSSNNQKTITLAWTPPSKELLEIYHNGTRVVGGWSLKGNVITFDSPLNGKIQIIDDTELIDPNLKWLKLPINNLLQSNDFDNTSYGTDRREGPQIAVHAQPIAITQPAIGFVRPSPSNEELWYSSYYGMFGRDSVTYAILTDNGQLSDYRCIDIRVRDPNYIPEIRMCAVSATGSPLKVNGKVVDVGAGTGFRIYGESANGAVVQLPNKKTLDEVKEYHFIIQGKDEVGEWFELTEYFDEDEYKLTYPKDNPDFVITAVGDAKAFGFDNAYRLSFTAKKNTKFEFKIKLEVMKRELFSATIFSTGVLDESLDYALVPGATTTHNLSAKVIPEIPVEPEEPVAIDDTEEPVDTAKLSFVFSYFPTAFNTLVSFSNSDPEIRTLEVIFTGLVALKKEYFNPNDDKFKLGYDVSKTYTGTLDSNPPKTANVTYRETVTLMPETFLWYSNDPFSQMAIVGPVQFTYVNVWTIT